MDVDPFVGDVNDYKDYAQGTKRIWMSKLGKPS